MKIELTVNQKPVVLDVAPHRRLLDVLREDLALTGSKEGCGEGECGACSVNLDGETVNSCLVAIAQCHGRRVVSIEGLASRAEAGADASAPHREVLHVVQNALLQFGGAQCGICTPGIAMCASEIVDKKLLVGKSPQAARDAVRAHLAGNICRCTGYQLIVDAVIAAAAQLEDVK